MSPCSAVPSIHRSAQLRGNSSHLAVEVIHSYLAFTVEIRDQVPHIGTPPSQATHLEQCYENLTLASSRALSRRT